MSSEMPNGPGPFDHLYVVVTEGALARPTTDREGLIALIEDRPFELVMILVSRLQGELVHLRTDSQAQLELAAIIYEEPQLLRGIQAFLNGGSRRLVFSEQNLTALQRLLVIRARADANLD